MGLVQLAKPCAKCGRNAWNFAVDREREHVVVVFTCIYCGHTETRSE